MQSIQRPSSFRQSTENWFVSAIACRYSKPLSRTVMIKVYPTSINKRPSKFFNPPCIICISPKFKDLVKNVKDTDITGWKIKNVLCDAKKGISYSENECWRRWFEGDWYKGPSLIHWNSDPITSSSRKPRACHNRKEKKGDISMNYLFFPKTKAKIKKGCRRVMKIYQYPLFPSEYQDERYKNRINTL